MLVPFAAVGTVGVPVSAGDTENTAEPVPVSSVKAAAKLALVGVAKNVATPTPRPDTPEPTGSPVQLVKVPEVGVPKIGLTKVGVLANTFAPVPVSSVRAAARLALDGVAKNVATPVPSPLTPEPTGRPVQLVNVPDVGIPNIGVTRVGLLANTFAPVPVSSVNAAAKLAEVKDPNEVALPTEVTAPVKLALVVTVLALPVTLPVKLAVIMPAEKLPEASRNTSVLAVLVDAIA